MSMTGIKTSKLYAGRPSVVSRGKEGDSRFILYENERENRIGM